MIPNSTLLTASGCSSPTEGGEAQPRSRRHACGTDARSPVGTPPRRRPQGTGTGGALPIIVDLSDSLVEGVGHAGR